MNIFTSITHSGLQPYYHAYPLHQLQVVPE